MQSGSKIGFDAVEALARMLKPLLSLHKRRVGTGFVADVQRESACSLFFSLARISASQLRTATSSARMFASAS
jgi:hypothetical protein